MCASTRAATSRTPTTNDARRQPRGERRVPGREERQSHGLALTGPLPPHVERPPRRDSQLPVRTVARVRPRRLLQHGALRERRRVHSARHSSRVRVGTRRELVVPRASAAFWGADARFYTRTMFCHECGHGVPEARNSARSAERDSRAAGRLRSSKLPVETRRNVTVLFIDVTGSTPLGERLDPEAVRRILSRYFGEVATIVARHGGTLEKFAGDALVAVFGLPVLHEDDALRAVRGGRGAGCARGRQRRADPRLGRAPRHPHGREHGRGRRGDTPPGAPWRPATW